MLAVHNDNVFDKINSFLRVSVDFFSFFADFFFFFFFVLPHNLQIVQ